MKNLYLLLLMGLFSLISCGKYSTNDVVGIWQFDSSYRYVDFTHKTDPSQSFSIEIVIEENRQFIIRRNHLGVVTLDSTAEFKERKKYTLNRDGSFNFTHFFIRSFSLDELVTFEVSGSWSFIGKNESTNNYKNDRIQFLGYQTIWQEEGLYPDSIVVNNSGETSFSGANPTLDTYYNTFCWHIIDINKNYLKVFASGIPSSFYPYPQSDFTITSSGHDQYKKN